MYPMAVQAGIPSDKYWLMTYHEIIVQVEANKRKKQEDIREQISLDYQQAQLMSYAMNNPKKMPKLNSLLPNFESENEVGLNHQGLEPWQIHKQMMLAKVKKGQS